MFAKLSERSQAIVRAVLLAGFVATWFGVALWAHGPRAFWTGFFPILPLAIVALGFHTWRAVCPLAAFNRFGQRVPRGKARRVGPFFEKHSYVVSLGVLAACLVARLLFINGDGVALGAFLALIALAAFATGVLYTGKTWCNFVCPIGIVEKIYTEPASLYPHGNSQCAKCTACKKHCPDIDAENHYWKELDSPARRTAYFAFPGLVWGFYLAFALPRGTLQDYFSGAWTRTPQQYRLATAPGLFFAEAVPRAVATPVFLLALMALSYGAFRGVESLVARRAADGTRARHVALSLAAFTAFTSFYLFAGQPLYRKLGALPPLVAVATGLVATLALARRWSRSEDGFVQERSVKKLLAKWPYDEAPPKDPKEVFAFVKSKERERDKVLAVYADSVREALADGVVEASEQRLLERLRAEFGITKAEHDKVFARLSAEDRALFDPSKATSIERRVQEQGYRLALQGLLVGGARDAEIDRLRRSYGVDAAAHARILAELRSTDSPLKPRVDEELARIDELRGLLADLAAVTRVRAFQLLYVMLLRRQAASVARVLELAGLIHGAAARVDALAPRVFADAVETRRAGLDALAEVDRAIAERLRPAVLERRPPRAEAADGDRLVRSLEALAHGPDAPVAAAALVAWAVSRPKDASGKVAPFAQHPHPLVREAAALAAAAAEPPEVRVVDALEADADAHVRAVAASARGVLRASLAPPVGAPRGGHRGLAAEDAARAAARTGEVAIDACAFAELPSLERMLVLASIPLFRELEPEQLYDIAVLATERSVAAGATLCREGEAGEEVYVVIAGRAEVYRGEGDGRNVVNEIKPGDCVGELAVLDEAPRAATVRALDAMRVLVIDGHAFRALLAREPDLSAALMTVITRRLRSVLARVPAGTGDAARGASGPVWAVAGAATTAQQGGPAGEAESA